MPEFLTQLRLDFSPKSSRGSQGRAEGNGRIRGGTRASRSEFPLFDSPFLAPLSRSCLLSPRSRFSFFPFRTMRNSFSEFFRKPLQCIMRGIASYRRIRRRFIECIPQVALTGKKKKKLGIDTAARPAGINQT